MGGCDGVGSVFMYLVGRLVDWLIGGMVVDCFMKCVVWFLNESFGWWVNCRWFVVGGLVCVFVLDQWPSFDSVGMVSSGVHRLFVDCRVVNC